MDELFDRADIKALSDYSLLKREYHNRIYQLFDPINFTQLIVESTLPGIYDAPSDRKKKIAGVAKLVKELGDKDGVDTSKNTITPPTAKVDNVTNNTGGIKKLAKIVAKKPMIYDDEDVDKQTVKEVEPKVQPVAPMSSSDFQAEPVIESPDLMYVQLGAHKYIYNPENAKIYKHETDTQGVLVGEIRNGKIVIENKSFSLTSEKVIELKDSETEQIFYKDNNGGFYEKINDVDGWVVGLDAEQTARLLPTAVSTES